MNRTIGAKTYDTDAAEMMARKTSGWYGDPHGFEEMLFRKDQEEFFLFGQGGSDSVYPEAGIVPLSIEDARNWLNDVVGPDAAHQICEPVVLWNEESRRNASVQGKGSARAAGSARSTAGKSGKGEAARKPKATAERKPKAAAESKIKADSEKKPKASAESKPKSGMKDQQKS